MTLSEAVFADTESSFKRFFFFFYWTGGYTINAPSPLTGIIWINSIWIFTLSTEATKSLGSTCNNYFGMQHLTVALFCSLSSFSLPSPLLPSSHILCVPLSNSFSQVDNWPWESERGREKESRTVLQCGLAALSLLHMQRDLSSASGALTRPCKPGHVLTTECIKEKKKRTHLR